MKNLVVVNSVEDWRIGQADFELVSAKDYLTHQIYKDGKRFRVYNLCRNYSYCSFGYYVSLLAQARGHRPLPSVSTILDMKHAGMIRHGSDELEDLIQKSLQAIRSKEFKLSIYFGKNLSPKYDRLSRSIYSLFRTPFIRVFFEKQKGGYWRIRNISPIPSSEIPKGHHDFVLEVMQDFFNRRRDQEVKKKTYKYDLAILVNPNEKLPPSDAEAIKKFIKAADRLKIWAEVIEPSEAARLMTFDALFIRETTNVDHHTYRMARRGEAEGLVVIDDPLSILRCCNKVFLYEILKYNQIATPKTQVFSSSNYLEEMKGLSYPLVLKDPDSAFSLGVKKVHSSEEFRAQAEEFFKDTDLLIGQEFVPTDFDWRVGVINHQPLYVCKYFMARSHWQIINSQGEKGIEEGRAHTFLPNEVPRQLVETALKAASLIGDGLYGVDLKEINGQYSVIEVNDNPSIDEGYEDKLLKSELYDRIMSVFYDRLESRMK
ncbi:MAG: RimK family protein [Bdellovibrionales bacterium]|nr:RimK family protein [Bdellovibrionales bacterium]